MRVHLPLRFAGGPANTQQASQGGTTSKASADPTNHTLKNKSSVDSFDNKTHQEKAHAYATALADGNGPKIQKYARYFINLAKGDKK